MGSRKRFEHPGGGKGEGLRRTDKRADESVPVGRLGVGLVKFPRQLLASSVSRLVPEPVIKPVENLHSSPSLGPVGLGLGEADALAVILNRPRQPLPEISMLGGRGLQRSRDPLLAAVDDEAAVANIGNRGETVLNGNDGSPNFSSRHCWEPSWDRRGQHIKTRVRNRGVGMRALGGRLRDSPGSHSEVCVFLSPARSVSENLSRNSHVGVARWGIGFDRGPAGDLGGEAEDSEGL